MRSGSRSGRGMARACQACIYNNVAMRSNSTFLILPISSFNCLHSILNRGHAWDESVSLPRQRLCAKTIGDLVLNHDSVRVGRNASTLYGDVINKPIWISDLKETVRLVLR